MARLDPRRLGVYVVTSDIGPGHREIATAAIKGGATAVQLRAPQLADDELGRSRRRWWRCAAMRAFPFW